MQKKCNEDKRRKAIILTQGTEKCFNLEDIRVAKISKWKLRTGAIDGDS